MADGLGYTPGVGATVATDEVNSQHVQRFKREVGADGVATDFLDKSSRTDTYTVPGAGTTIDVSAQAMKSFSMQVKGGSAAADAWEAVLEGSLNNTQFTTILTHSNVVTEFAPASADGAVIGSGPSLSPYLYFRSRLVSATLGSATNLAVVICGK